MNTSACPADGFQVRPATQEDAGAIVEVMRACDIAENLPPDQTVEELLADWQSTRLNLATDTAIVVSREGQVAGYGEAWVREPYVLIQGDGYVHPTFTGRGIGSTLLRWMEDRAAHHALEAPMGSRITIRNGIRGANQAARTLHEQHGWTMARQFWRMAIELMEPPPVPEWPQGITMRTFRPGQDERRVYEAVTEAFAQHWGSVQPSFENWVASTVDPEKADLWFLAVQGEGIAGSVLCKYKDNLGWVRTLAVPPGWRHRGIGLALLRQAFGEFYRRGTRTVALSVDSDNTTGATRLYQRAGMHVVDWYLVYEKEVSAGMQRRPCPARAEEREPCFK